MRPLARTRADKAIAATLLDDTALWRDGERRITAQVWNGLVLPDAPRRGRVSHRGGA